MDGNTTLNGVRYLPTMTTIAKHHQRPLSQVLVTFGVYLVQCFFLFWMISLYQDYRAFKALGPGGTPSTVRGFLRVHTLSYFRIRNPYNPSSRSLSPTCPPGYLTGLSHRGGPRPKTKGIAPHRQVTQRANAEDYKSLDEAIKDLATANEHLFTRTSCFEKHGEGLFASSPVKRTCDGEICHAHRSDGSMHMTLHPADARVVLEAGWAERHPLARGGCFERFVPAGFIMIYAPRDETDIETLVQIIQAAAWFVSGGASTSSAAAGRCDGTDCEA